jgi:glycosyltransferase involved in cell wall biosynthesis
MSVTIITPLRDELDNIPLLFKSISQQTTPIDLWVICENGSVDGSREALMSIPKPSNVKQLAIINIDTSAPEYSLGFNYARIVSHGFKFAASISPIGDGYIGILDADCFPEPRYYEKLVNEFKRRPKLGIVSGTLTAPTGEVHRAAKGFPRGNCRLWRGACLEEAGYVIGMSADTLSFIKARLRGWHADSIAEATVVTREVGARGGQRYYGASAHFRGETLAFTLLKAVAMAVRRPSNGVAYLWGYLERAASGASVVDDEEIRAYSRMKLWSKVRGN